MEDWIKLTNADLLAREQSVYVNKAEIEIIEGYVYNTGAKTGSRITTKNGYTVIVMEHPDYVYNQLTKY